MSDNHLISILGPTASGKTSVAVNLAAMIGGEIISADSRQVYKRMDIGTGKDLDEFNINGQQIPYHLMDIREPGYEYNIFEYQKDFVDAHKIISQNNNLPIMCGGSGMYIDSILRVYEMKEIQTDANLKEELSFLSDKQLIARLNSISNLHNSTDIKLRERLIRANLIASAENERKEITDYLKSIKSLNFGIMFERKLIKERITDRLNNRLDNGMLDEIESLLKSGLTKDQLMFYGLEYRFLTEHVLGETSFAEMFENLNTAIHQFAKRQMTWYRRMEKNGIRINWINGELEMEEKISLILNIISKHT